MLFSIGKIMQSGVKGVIELPKLSDHDINAIARHFKFTKTDLVTYVVIYMYIKMSDNKNAHVNVYIRTNGSLYISRLHSRVDIGIIWNYLSIQLLNIPNFSYRNLPKEIKYIEFGIVMFSCHDILQYIGKIEDQICNNASLCNYTCDTLFFNDSDDIKMILFTYTDGINSVSFKLSTKNINDIYKLRITKCNNLIQAVDIINGMFVCINSAITSRGNFVGQNKS